MYYAHGTERYGVKRSKFDYICRIPYRLSNNYRFVLVSIFREFVRASIPISNFASSFSEEYFAFRISNELNLVYLMFHN